PAPQPQCCQPAPQPCCAPAPAPTCCAPVAPAPSCCAPVAPSCGAPIPHGVAPLPPGEGAPPAPVAEPVTQYGPQPHYHTVPRQDKGVVAESWDSLKRFERKKNKTLMKMIGLR